MREVVERLVGGVLTKGRSFLCQRLARGFVCLVGRDPKLPAQGNRVIIDRCEIHGTNSGPKIAVLLVIPQPSYYPRVASVSPLILAQRSEGGFRVIGCSVREVILDVVGRGNIFHFQMRLRALQLFSHGAEQGVGGGGTRSGGARLRSHLLAHRGDGADNREQPY